MKNPTCEMKRRIEKSNYIVFTTTLNGEFYEERIFTQTSFKGKGTHDYLEELRERFHVKDGFNVTQELRKR